MDAFLKPSPDTDGAGVPLRLKTLGFHKQLQSKLTPDGVVMYNVNRNPTLEGDVATIQDAFSQTYVFQVPRSVGVVVAGSVSPERVPSCGLLSRAGELDRRFRTSFSFQEKSAH